MTTGNLSPLPWLRFCDNNGRPLAGGRLYTYEAGTTTPTPTYTDSTFQTPNENPVRLNARGEASVWLVEGQFYKFVLQDAHGYPLWTQDQIASDAALGFTPVEQGDDTKIILTATDDGHIDANVGGNDEGNLAYVSDLAAIESSLSTIDGEVGNLNSEMDQVTNELTTIDGEIAALQDALSGMGQGGSVPAGYDPLTVNGIGYVTEIWVNYIGDGAASWPAEGTIITLPQQSNTNFAVLDPWPGGVDINTPPRPGSWMASSVAAALPGTTVNGMGTPQAGGGAYAACGLFVRVA